MHVDLDISEDVLVHLKQYARHRVEALNVLTHSEVNVEDLIGVLSMGTDDFCVRLDDGDNVGWVWQNVGYFFIHMDDEESSSGKRYRMETPEAKSLIGNSDVRLMLRRNAQPFQNGTSDGDGSTTEPLD